MVNLWDLHECSFMGVFEIVLMISSLYSIDVMLILSIDNIDICTVFFC